MLKLLRWNVSKIYSSTCFFITSKNKTLVQLSKCVFTVCSDFRHHLQIDCLQWSSPKKIIIHCRSSVNNVSHLASSNLRKINRLFTWSLFIFMLTGGSEGTRWKCQMLFPADLWLQSFVSFTPLSFLFLVCLCKQLILNQPWSRLRWNFLSSPPPSYSCILRFSFYFQKAGENKWKMSKNVFISCKEKSCVHIFIHTCIQ